MPNSKSHRRGPEEKSRRGKMGERASSFHGGSSSPGPFMGERILTRPRTVPDLLPGRRGGGVQTEERPKLTKLLLNVTIQRSLGAVQVVMSPESTVGDLIAAALRQYAKEGRRPMLSIDPSAFDLHYSQFSLESLNREVQLTALGSRNFFLCPAKPSSPSASGGGGGVTTASTSCSKQAEKANKIGVPWFKFLSF